MDNDFNDFKNLMNVVVLAQHLKLSVKKFFFNIKTYVFDI